MAYLIIIGSLLPLGMPSSQVGGALPISGTIPVLWLAHDVGASTASVTSVAAGDLDNDGDLDIVAGTSYPEDYQVIVWENDGTPFTDLWTQNDVGASMAWVKSVAVGDLDNDGDLDIVSGSDYQEDYEVIVWENDGTPFTDLWTQNDVGACDNAYSVAFGDLDNDGDLDIVSGSYSGEDYEVIAWENDGSPFTDLWSQNDVGAAMSVHSVALGDLDNDGDLDIVSGTGPSNLPGEVVAWENDSSPFTDLWTRNNVGATTTGVSSVALKDLDDDGHLDIVSGSYWGHDYEVKAWENDGSPFTDLWNKNDVGRSAESVFSVALGDLDGDGDLDIVSGSGHSDWRWEVIAWENDGTPFSGVWSRNDVGQSEGYVRSVALGDLDNDGDLDIVSGSDYEVIAWENTPFFASYLPFVAKNYLSYFCDDFSDPGSGWHVGETREVKYSYQDGEYEILLRSANWWAGVTAPIGGLTDYSVEADMRRTEGRTTAYGLIFGLLDWDHFYVFIVHPGAQYYSVWRVDPTDWVAIVDWAYSSQINPSSETNHLKVERKGSQITVSVNDMWPRTVNDGTYTGSQEVGLWAGSGADARAAARFDNFCARWGTGAAVREISVPHEMEMLIDREVVPPSAR